MGHNAMAVNIAQRAPDLKNITIKPEYACGAACFFCKPRQELYNSIRNERLRCMSVAEWASVLHDASNMGVKQVTVSGGEPTLYRNIVALVAAIRKAGMKTSMNSNGLHLYPQASALVKAGLNDVTISIYSHSEKQHDEIKGRAGLWKRAVSAIHSLVQLRDQGIGDLTIGLYFLVLRENFRNLREYLKFARNLGVDYVFMSHLIGKLKDQGHYLTRADFKELSGHGAGQLLSEVVGAEVIDINDIEKIDRFLGLGNDDGYCAGQYLGSPSLHVGCNTPNEFCLVLANGDVHACNMVENSHDGVIGNVLDTPLHDVFVGPAASRFRIQQHDFCAWCSVPLNMKIQLR